MWLFPSEPFSFALNRGDAIVCIPIRESDDDSSELIEQNLNLAVLILYAVLVLTDG